MPALSKQTNNFVSAWRASAASVVAASRLANNPPANVFPWLQKFGFKWVVRVCVSGRTPPAFDPSRAPKANSASSRRRSFHEKCLQCRRFRGSAPPAAACTSSTRSSCSAGAFEQKNTAVGGRRGPLGFKCVTVAISGLAGLHWTSASLRPLT